MSTDTSSYNVRLSPGAQTLRAASNRDSIFPPKRWVFARQEEPSIDMESIAVMSGFPKFTQAMESIRLALIESDNVWRRFWNLPTYAEQKRIGRHLTRCAAHRERRRRRGR